jgi:hypothetical protein
LISRYYWDASIPCESIEELISSSKSLLGFIPPELASQIANIAEGLGNIRLSNDIVFDWTSKNEDTIASMASSPDLLDFGDSLEGVHPFIADQIKTRHEQIYKAPTLLEAIIHIQTNQGHGTRQLAPFKATSTSSIEALLRDCDYKLLPTVLKFFARRLRSRSSDIYFGDACEHFISACSNIVKSDPDSRLAEIITRAAKPDAINFTITV